MEKIDLGREKVYTYNPDKVHMGEHSVVRHGTILEAINGEIEIGNYAVITQYCLIDGPTTIGVGCIIGPGTKIVTHDHNFDDLDMPIYKSAGAIKPIVIEDNCYIGAGCIILQGVTIHKGAVIGAGSVITKDIPSGVVAYGNPCKVRRKRGRKK